MGDTSQSRYSIVERLTQTKLDIIGAKNELTDDIKHKEQGLNSLRKDFDNWKIDVQEDVKRAERQKQIEIEKAEINLKNARERQDEKLKTYDLKIKSIDEALTRIEEISKTTTQSS